MFPSAFNFPQYRFDFEGLNFDCTAPALFLGMTASRRHLEALVSRRTAARRANFLRMTSGPRRADSGFARRLPVVSGRNWSRMRRLTPKSDDGFPQHRVDATSASSKRLNRADGNLQPSISVAINVRWQKARRSRHNLNFDVAP
jgi:hypothetical protein